MNIADMNLPAGCWVTVWSKKPRDGAASIARRPHTNNAGIQYESQEGRCTGTLPSSDGGEEIRAGCLPEINIKSTEAWSWTVTATGPLTCLQGLLSPRRRLDRRCCALMACQDLIKLRRSASNPPEPRFHPGLSETCWRFVTLYHRPWHHFARDTAGC